MACYSCGNCQSGESTYYCLEKNAFVVVADTKTIEKSEKQANWKKGDKEYENLRRIRKEKQ